MAINDDGAMPKVHAIIAPETTCSGMVRSLFVASRSSKRDALGNPPAVNALQRPSYEGIAGMSSLPCVEPSQARGTSGTRIAGAFGAVVKRKSYEWSA
jgi:hypothetical protein